MNSFLCLKMSKTHFILVFRIIVRGNFQAHHANIPQKKRHWPAR